MISLTRLVALLASVVAAEPLLAQDKETPQAQTDASEKGEAPRAKNCWPTRNVGIAETSEHYYGSCKAQRAGDEAPQQ